MASVYNNSSMAVTRRRATWQDWVNLALAIWLFVSPWVLQFGHGLQQPSNGAVATAAWDAWILGVLVFIAAASEIGSIALWQEWLALIFGAWIFIAPWALGFSQLANASWDHWIVGALVFLIAACSLAQARTARNDMNAGPIDRPPQQPAA
jgi:hypothetical protein